MTRVTHAKPADDAQQPARFAIRHALSTDAADIARLYNAGGVATTASFDIAPRTTADRRAWLAQLTRDGFPVLVATEDEAVVGFADYAPFRRHDGYAHTVEHSVYVADTHQRVGIGGMLLTALIDHARSQGVHAMIGVLDATNDASLRLHERLGFTTVGMLREVGFKFGRWLDATFVELLLDDPAMV